MRTGNRSTKYPIALYRRDFNTIFIGECFFDDERIVDVLSHEYMHYVLEKLEGHATSMAFDAMPVDARRAIWSW